jgi:nucleoside-diphosphate-sugar epimerase
MRVVVLGATGNVGTSVVQRLLDEPDVETIVGVARRTPEWRPAKTTWVEADVATDDLVSCVTGADAVVHLAWRFQPTHRPLVTWEANAVGSARVLDAVGRAGVPVLVYASSVGAYSPSESKERVDESWPTHGWSPAAYCREKAYVERLLDRLELQRPDCRVVRMRPCFLFKKESAPQQRRIFAGPLVPERLAGSVRLPLVPDVPGLVLQAMHTDDAADAYVRAVMSDVRGAFNLTAEPVVDRDALAEILGGRPAGPGSSPAGSCRGCRRLARAAEPGCSRPVRLRPQDAAPRRDAGPPRALVEPAAHVDRGPGGVPGGSARPSRVPHAAPGTVAARVLDHTSSMARQTCGRPPRDASRLRPPPRDAATAPLMDRTVPCAS